MFRRRLIRNPPAPEHDAPPDRSGLSLARRFAEFQGRVGPGRAVEIQGRVACRGCGSLFPTSVFIAASEALSPSTVIEPATQICPRCATLALQAQARTRGTRP